MDRTITELLQIGTVIVGSGIIWIIFFGMIIGACELLTKLTKRKA